MSYPATVQYLESFIDYEKTPVYPYKESLKLERVKNFLTRFGNPQDSLKCLHIAGTKGKGSTCAFVTYILREAGFKVGFYTSPHLSDFRERIRILEPRTRNQEPRTNFEGIISREKVSALVKRLRPLIQSYNKYSEYGPLTFFEVYTSLAFLYFREEKVDFAVLETGLGGRLDATNVVSPLVAAITPISYEHTQKLGCSLREIASEKAGIIKSQESGSPCLPAGRRSQKLIVISAPQEKEAAEVIRNKCKETASKLYEVGKDINYAGTNNDFQVKGVRAAYPHLKMKLLGAHQLINASVAIGIIEALKSYDINVGPRAIRGGLYNTVWPGRCEVASRGPLTVLDGAQNVASMRALKETVRESFRYKRLILVLGISSDKDIKGICNEIYDLADEIILTKADSARATSPETLVKYFNGKEVRITDNVKEAHNIASRISKREDLILVCGSLFVVGEFRNGKI